MRSAARHVVVLRDRTFCRSAMEGARRTRPPRGEVDLARHTFSSRSALSSILATPLRVALGERDRGLAANRVRGDIEGIGALGDGDREPEAKCLRGDAAGRAARGDGVRLPCDIADGLAERGDRQRRGWSFNVLDTDGVPADVDR